MAEADSSTASVATRSVAARSFAALPKSQPTSTVCAVTSLFSDLKLLQVGSIEEFVCTKPLYNLQQMCQREGVQYNISNEADVDDNPTKVEEIGLLYVNHVLCGCNGYVASEAQYDREVAAFNLLPSCVYSSMQRPDVSVMVDGNLILSVEIESCSSRDSFKNTIRKCILGVIDTIRHYKTMGLSLTHEWSGLVFPKFLKLATVVKVHVKFDINCFQFVYSLAEVKLSRIADEIRAVFSDNINRYRHIRKRPGQSSQSVQSELYMKLSTQELDFFAQSVMEKSVSQMNSMQSLLLKGENKCYKLPVRTKDCRALYVASQQLGSACASAIKLELPQSAYNYFMYDYVFWPPLKVDQIRACLGDFVIQVATCVTQLHAHSLAHLDLRIENICFHKDSYSPVLIDLDRSSPFALFGNSDIYSNSVMYSPQLNADQHDWRQLGCMILWTLTHELQHSYHKQSIFIDDATVRALAKDKFFNALWTKGLYLPVSFNNFNRIYGGSDTIKTVIQCTASSLPSHRKHKRSGHSVGSSKRQCK